MALTPGLFYYRKPLKYYVHFQTIILSNIFWFKDGVKISHLNYTLVAKMFNVLLLK